MPKQVDVQQRRRLIARALQRVVGAHGLSGVTLRTVATEAGISMGLVQHYFATKEEMLLFALDSIEEQIGERFSAQMVAEPAADRRTAVRTLLLQSLPLDEERRRESLTFLMAGLQLDSVGKRIRSGLLDLSAFIATSLREVGYRGQPDEAANELIALHEGLSVLLLGGFATVDDALAILDRHLDRLFSTEPGGTGG